MEFVLPHLHLCEVMGTDAPPNILGAFKRDLYYAVTTLQGGRSQESYLFDKYAALNWDVWRLAHTAESTSHAVALLHHCHEKGVLAVKSVCAYDACIVCKSRSQKTYLVKDLLDSYRGVSSSPAAPFPDCQQLHMDGGGLCRCVWKEIPNPPATEKERRVHDFVSRLMRKHGLESRRQ